MSFVKLAPEILKLCSVPVEPAQEVNVENDAVVEILDLKLPQPHQKIGNLVIRYG